MQIRPVLHAGDNTFSDPMCDVCFTVFNFTQIAFLFFTGGIGNIKDDRK